MTDNVTPGGRAYFLRLLAERDEDLANLYSAAVWLIDMSRFGGRSRLLGHAVRELRRDLPALFARTKKPKKLEHHNRLTKIAKRWEPEVRPHLGVPASIDPASDGLPTDSAPMAEEGAVSVPSRLADDIDSLIIADAVIPVTLRKQFLEMCNEVNREVLRWQGNQLLADRWKNGLEVAEDLAHSGGGAADEERAEQVFCELENLVLLIFQPAPERERVARELAETASPDTVIGAVARLVTMPDHSVFYKNLRRADLLPTLGAARVFHIPLGDAEPAYWPEAEYLANVAADEPVLVADIIAALHARKPGVVRQLLAVALRLPDGRLGRVARRAKWLREAQSVTLYGGYREAMGRLARAGNLGVAFALGESLLRLRSERDTIGTVFGESERATPLVGMNAFGDALKAVVSELGSADAVRTMALLADTVDAALAIEGREEYDMSSSWLPNILDSGGRYHVAGMTAGALADFAIDIAANRADEVFAFLNGRKPGQVYERIALAVVVRCSVVAIARQRLLDRDLWLRRWPEHIALVEAFYPGLEAPDRAAIFDVARGALEPWFTSMLVDAEKPRNDDAERVLANLAASFGDALGEVPEPDGSRLRAAIAATSPAVAERPLDAEVLEDMLPREVVAELWRSEASVVSQDAWGLGQAVWRLVEREPEKWLADDVITELPDRYLGWALRGLHNWRNATKPRHDAAALAVLEKALRRAYALAARGGDAELAEARDLAQPAGLTLADLARDTSDAETLDRIVASAKVLGSMAQRRVDAAHGSPEHATSAALGNPHALAVVVAGEALNAAIRRDLDKAALVDLYDAHTHDESLAVRAALGGRFAMFLDWAGARAADWAGRIFFSGNERADEAAWAGYVLRSRLTRVTYPLLRPAYVRRIADMRSTERNQPDDVGAVRSSDAQEVREKTIAHAWILAWNGDESIERDGSLLRLVLDVAPPKLVEALLHTVAGDLNRPGPDPKTAESIASEGMRVWHAVRAGVEADRQPASVLATFGLWARAPILPAEWRLAEMEALMEIPGIDLAYQWEMVRGIVGLADHDMPRALRALRALGRRRDVQAMTAISEHAGPLLRSGVVAGSESQLLAIEINSILRSNFYRDLLDDTND